MARQTKVDFSGFFSAGTGSTGIRPLPSRFCLSSQTTCFHTAVSPVGREHRHIENGICCRPFYILAFHSSLKRIQDPEGKWYTDFIA